MIFLLIVVVAGWFAADYLGNNARQEIIGESRGDALTLSIHVSDTLNHFQGTVKSLAGAVWIAPALMSMEDQDIERANSTLDRYNSAMNASVTYLMDADGMTVASSNRKDADSFIGKSYRFRPYFQQAAQGQPGHYFALGITSGKMGFYASYPVQNRLSKVLGVVTMKKNLDEMETFFSQYPFCFLISPDGIIFLSSRPAMVLKSLWPLDKTTHEKLIASRQFGNKLFEAVFLKKEIADGTEVTLEGKDYLVSRKVIDSDGWSIVLLTPTDRIRIYKLIGILATIIVCFSIIVFSGILYLTNRSREAIRQSEESKRLLLQAAGEGIFGVDTIGQTTFVNPAAQRMLGFFEEEMLGQSAHTLIHHSHKDGSNYPKEDCPMYASYTKATENRVTEEVLWRKDGSSFPVDYFSSPIIRDGRIMGAVVVFTDITERKKTEEALYRSEERYRIIIEQMEDGYFETDLSGNFTFVNNAESRNLGYTREELIGMNNQHYVDEINRKKLDNLFIEVYQTGIPIKAYALELIKKDGAKAYNEISVTLIRNVEGKPIGFRGISRDITERKRSEEALHRSETKFHTLYDSNSDAVMLLDEKGFFDCNKATLAIFGCVDREEFCSKHPADLSPLQQPCGTDSMVLGNQMIATAMEKGSLHFEWMYKRNDTGKTFPADVLLTAMELDGKMVVQAVVRDITERKRLQENLEYFAIHDILTGLLNRRSLEEMLNRTIARAKRGAISSLLYMDLDNFKDVNDKVGHAAGDEVLKILSDLLKAELRTEDIVFRLGGDEFAVLLEGMDNGKALPAAERLRLVVEKHRFELSGRLFPLSLSIGLIEIEGTLTTEELLSQADAAMYRAKAQGKNCVAG